MGSGLFFAKKKYIPIKDASVLTGYSKDYIGQLCRQNKIISTRVGRAWYVEKRSILKYKSSPSSFDFSRNLFGSNLKDKKNNLSLKKPISRLFEIKKSKSISKINTKTIGFLKMTHTGLVLILHRHFFIKKYNPVLKLISVTIGLILTIGLVSAEEKVMQVLPTFPETVSRVALTITEKISSKAAYVSDLINGAPVVVYTSFDDIVSLYADSLNVVYSRVGAAIYYIEGATGQEWEGIAHNPPLYISDFFKKVAIGEKHNIDLTFAEVKYRIETAHEELFSFISQSIGGFSYIQPESTNFSVNVASSVEVKNNDIDRLGQIVYETINRFFQCFS